MLETYKEGDIIRIRWNESEFVVTVVAYLGTNFKGSIYLVKAEGDDFPSEITDRNIIGLVKQG